MIYNKFHSSEDAAILRYVHPSLYKINYDNMQIGDIWGTSNNAITGQSIKRATWGIIRSKFGFSLELCNHIAIVIKIEKQFFLAEALDHIVISSTYRYLNPTWTNGWNQVCFIGRFNLTPVMQARLNEWLILIADCYAEYDLAGAIGTEIPLFKQNVNKLFCSEFAAEGLRKVSSFPNFLSQQASWQFTPKHFQEHMENIKPRIICLK